MKTQQFTFPHPLKVVQFWCHTYVYGKEQRSAPQREGLQNWKVISKNGHVENGELYLLEDFVRDSDLRGCHVITLEDFWFNKRGPRGGPVPSGINRALDLSEPAHLHIFRLEWHDALELFLEDNDKYSIPRRESFKIGELRPRQPIEVRINSKTSDALNGTDRLLQEQTFIIEYLGDFASCNLLREPFGYVSKPMPPRRKVVDLLQKLWM